MSVRRTIHAKNPHFPASETLKMTTGEGDKPGTVLICLPGVGMEVWPHDADLFAAAIQDEARRVRERSGLSTAETGGEKNQ